MATHSENALEYLYMTTQQKVESLIRQVVALPDERLNRPFGTPAQRERFLEGLRRAGLPDE